MNESTATALGADDPAVAARQLSKGNHAICDAALRAGCRYYFGYPITPQNEIPEYMAVRLPEVGGTMVQAESELAAINMVYGAAAAGARVMTSSSSPGISLMQEGISWLAAAELPAVIVNVMRCGPGLGNVASHQGDYLQAAKGGGHGDYRLIVLAPASVQEAAGLTYLAFELADYYRNPVMVLADGIIGQMMEPVDLAHLAEMQAPFKDWSIRPRQAGEATKYFTTIYLDPPEMAEKIHRPLRAKYELIRSREVRYESFMAEDADLLYVAFGTVSRVCRSAIRKLRAEGVRAGMVRPITTYPFPYRAISEAGRQARAVLVAEMNFGQLVEDVAAAVGEDVPVHFVGKHGGMQFNTDEIVTAGRVALGDPEGAPSRWRLYE
ncbi:MAG: 3-methyl-2-oxobutanoate dehydrogenase subunit VorB [Candidatus Sericytochromatia bacterium]|nr:3-methyl-2-oxobutanoate dehydrogenase subunit VorB [Candidatus Tanganyikabacteria bacterium]